MLLCCSVLFINGDHSHSPAKFDIYAPSLPKTSHCWCVFFENMNLGFDKKIPFEDLCE